MQRLWMLLPPKLESRQSKRLENLYNEYDAAPTEIGIKAKRHDRRRLLPRRCCSHRNWNQGKAFAGIKSVVGKMLLPPKLESRQSRQGCGVRHSNDAAPTEIGIKAKHISQPRVQVSGCCSHRNWNQGKAGIVEGLELFVMLLPPKLESRQSIYSRNRFIWSMLLPPKLESRQSKELIEKDLEGDAAPTEIGIKAKRKETERNLMD